MKETNKAEKNAQKRYQRSETVYTFNYELDYVSIQTTETNAPQ